jgi:putative phosphoesterase
VTLVTIAAIYDIHGNLPALEAVLDDVRAAGVDEIVVVGDVLPGLEFPVRALRGNGDRAVLDHLAGLPIRSAPEAFHPRIHWNAEQVSVAQRAEMEAWPATISAKVRGVGEVLFCHATPRSDVEIFVRTTPEEKVLPSFQNVSADVVVCGHTHMQFDRTVGRVRVVNAGSVGMPFGEPGAYWLLLGDGIEFRRTPYDIEAAVDRFRASGYPWVDEIAGGLLTPRSEDEMIAAFSKSEMG